MPPKKEQCEFNTLEPNPIMEIAQFITKIGRKFDRLQSQLVQSANLTPPQYFIMQILWNHDGIPFKDIAAACCCTRSTVSDIIALLKKKGLVTDQEKGEDRRIHLVQLTDQGKAIRNKVPPAESIFGTCCGGMDLNEIKQLKDLLQKLFNLLPD